MRGEGSLDVTRPNAARVYDVLLGGSSGFAADREEAARLLAICPQLASVARENRAFLIRAVTWAARQGIRQFADLGTGMPAHPSVGVAARAVTPSVRLIYVDSDPVVTAHVRAMLAKDDGAASLDANLADPAAVLADPAWRAVIDPGEPVCLIFGLVLSLMPARQARQVVAGYAGLVAPGSYVALSCGRCDDEELGGRLREACTIGTLHNHAPAEVAGFLEGLELVPPGIVAAQNWRGGWHDVPVTAPGPAYVLAGVARKK